MLGVSKIWHEMAFLIIFLLSITPHQSREWHFCWALALLVGNTGDTEILTDRPQDSTNVGSRWHRQSPQVTMFKSPMCHETKQSKPGTWVPKKEIEELVFRWIFIHFKTSHNSYIVYVMILFWSPTSPVFCHKWFCARIACVCVRVHPHFWADTMHNLHFVKHLMDRTVMARELP